MPRRPRQRTVDEDAFLGALGAALRDARSERFSSSDQFAAEADVDPGWAARVERGAANATTLTLLKLCRGLGIRPSELLARAEEKLPSGYWSRPRG